MREFIKKYDPNKNNHIVEITLMQWEYYGHIYIEVGGNCKGLDVLTACDFETDSFEDNEKDFELTYYEYEDYFYYVLHNDDGDTLEGEADSSEMNDMIVSVRFVHENRSVV